MTISLIFCLIVVAILVGCVIILVRTVKRMQSEREFLEDRIEQMTICLNLLQKQLKSALQSATIPVRKCFERSTLVYELCK